MLPLPGPEQADPGIERANSAPWGFFLLPRKMVVRLELHSDGQLHFPWPMGQTARRDASSTDGCLKASASWFPAE